MEPMDGALAQEALSSLQTRHNAELASLAALKMEAGAARARAAELPDLTLHRPGMHVDARAPVERNDRCANARLRGARRRFWRSRSASSSDSCDQ